MATRAYVLIRTTPEGTARVYGALKELKGVGEFHPVTGRFDGVVTLEGKDVKELTALVVQKIRTIPGIKDTETLIVSE